MSVFTCKIVLLIYLECPSSMQVDVLYIQDLFLLENVKNLVHIKTRYTEPVQFTK